MKEPDEYARMGETHRRLTKEKRKRMKKEQRAKKKAERIRWFKKVSGKNHETR